jgi:beta-galactosidase
MKVAPAFAAIAWVAWIAMAAPASVAGPAPTPMAASARDDFPASGVTALAPVSALVSVAGAVRLPPSAVASQPEPRVVQQLADGWRFKQSSDIRGVEAASYDDSSWAQVTVPHTWNRIGNEGVERSPLSNNIQGVGWYRLRFKTPAAATAPARYFLQFDAVSTIADVWLNGHYLGKHEGAFARFRFDASSAINPSGDNLLVVKADNSRPQPGASTENVPPLSGDFFMFGGIYRSAALIVTSAVHVDLLDFGGPGVYPNALEITPTAATVQVTTRLANDGRVPEKVQVECVIVDESGNAVATTSNAVEAPAANGTPAATTARQADATTSAAEGTRAPPGTRAARGGGAGDATSTGDGATPVTLVRSNLTIPNPHLWQGTRDPYLYQTIVTIRSSKGAVLDRVIQPLGLRTVKFDADKGFFLNGEHQYLKGVAMHQDRPIKGWAISDADQAEDFDILADMGATAVRLAHYQHDQRSYELADARGIVLWAEVPLVNKVSFDGSPANAAFAANARQQLIELIRQNRNHPSIALWSIANEIDLTATQTKGRSQPGSLLRTLNLLAKTEDPGRYTTFADCCEVDLPPHVGRAVEGISPREQIVGLADTIGYNRYFGWYTGNLSDFGPMLDQAHARHPKLPISVSEYGAGAALTQHTDDPTGGPINPHGRPHPEELQTLYHEQSWNALRQRSYVWGSFIWNMFDFSSDSRKEGDLTDINEKGLVSYDRRTRKDAFYFYRANWSDQPTLHLVGRRYVDRAYAVVDVKAYSNATRAALSLNGSELGTTPCAGGICLWRAVHLRPGTNDLRATAEIGGVPATDQIQWTVAGSPAVVRIKAGDLSGYVSQAHERFGSDCFFVGGEGKGVNAPDTPNEKRIEVAAADARLYDSFREGEFSYRVPVPDGRYKVTLRFEEPSAGAAGERVFDVEVNGKTLLKHFDVFAAAGGKLRAVDRSFDVKARDGVLNIDFHPIKGQPLVSALAITPAK